MKERAPITKAALHALLAREFDLLRAQGCAKCRPVPPRRLGEGSEWACEIAPCELGCHREFSFLTRLYSQQYRLRDLCDTLG